MPTVKKEKPVKVKILTPEEIKQAEANIEPPKELSIVRDQYGIGLAKEVVDGHLNKFLPLFSQIVDLEPEFLKINTENPTDEDVKAAVDLKKKYQTVRTTTTETHKTAKADALKEGTLLDKFKNTVIAGATIKEDALKAVIDFAEKAEQERLENVSTERKTLLAAQDYDAEFLTDLGSMEQERFDRLLTKATEAKVLADKAAKFDAAEEKAEQEKKDKLDNRNKLVLSLGFVFVAENNRFESPEGFIDQKAIENSEDDAFSKWYDQVNEKRTARLKTEEEKLAEEREKQTKITNRINAVSKLGLTFDEVSESYTGYKQTITLEAIKDLSAEAFTVLFNAAKINVNKAITAKAEEDKLAKKKQADLVAENARLKKIEDDRIAKENLEKEQAKAAALAPDKEKFRVFYDKMRALKDAIPVLESEEGQKACAEMSEGFKILVTGCKNAYMKYFK